MSPQRVLIAIRDRVLADILRRALKTSGRMVMGRMDPAQHNRICEWLAPTDVLVMDARELRALRSRRAFLRQLAPEVQLLIVTTLERLAEVFGLPSRINGLLIVDPARGVDPDQLELALSGYCAVPEQALRNMLGLDWRRIVLDRLDESERRVLHLLGTGSRNSDIAAAMGCDESRAKTMVRSVLDKLGIPNRTIAGIVANRLANPQQQPEGRANTGDSDS